MKNALLWLWFWLIQLFDFCVLSPIGLVLLALPCLLRQWEPWPSPMPPPHEIQRWRGIWRWLNPIWGNDEDGVTGAVWYRAKYGDSAMTAYRWSALRNRNGNFRFWKWIYVIGGPFFRSFFTDYDIHLSRPFLTPCKMYFQAGFRPGNGWPIISAGTVPEGGFDY